MWLLLSGETVVHEMLFVTEVTREWFCLRAVFHRLAAATVPSAYSEPKRLSQLPLAALLAWRNITWKHSAAFHRPPSLPTPVAVIKLKSVILE